MLTALDITAQSSSHQTIRNTLLEIRQHLLRGESLETALRSISGGVSSFFTNMLILGYRTGTITMVLLQLERYYLTLLTIQRAIRSIIWYPLFLLLCYSFVFTVTSIIILSQKRTVTLVEMLQIFWLGYMPFFLAFVCAYAVVKFLKEVELKKYVDRVVLAIPILGVLFKAFYLCIFFRALSIAIDCGMVLIEGLAIAIDTVENDWIQFRLNRALKFIRDGESLHKALEITGILPADALGMAVAADHAAEWSKLFNRLADYYQSEIQTITPGLIKSSFVFLMVFVALIMFAGVPIGLLTFILIFMFFLIR